MTEPKIIFPINVPCPRCGAPKGKPCGVVHGGIILHGVRGRP